MVWHAIEWNNTCLRLKMRDIDKMLHLNAHLVWKMCVCGVGQTSSALFGKESTNTNILRAYCGAKLGQTLCFKHLHASAELGKVLEHRSVCFQCISILGQVIQDQESARV